ncbi:hypothetical protein JW766_06365 [Candidatus Dojkabacteria bacterium]|nr:hypothetical protein [Candidatus Dojkabacteria bacterium]
MEPSGEITVETLVQTALEQGYIDVPYGESRLPVNIHGVVSTNGCLPDDHPMHGHTFFVDVENQLQIAFIDVEEVLGATQAEGNFPSRHLFRSDVNGYFGYWTDACYPQYVANPTSFPMDGDVGLQLKAIVQAA